MNTFVIIVIIGIYGIYKIVDRTLEHKELLEEADSDIYNILGKVIDENRELWERLLEKEEVENLNGVKEK